MASEEPVNFGQVEIELAATEKASSVAMDVAPKDVHMAEAAGVELVPMTPKMEGWTTPKLICFPWAGGSSTLYQPWLTPKFSAVEVVPVELPGRMSRAGTPPLTDLKLLARTLVSELTESGMFNGKFALFGFRYLPLFLWVSPPPSKMCSRILCTSFVSVFPLPPFPLFTLLFLVTR